MTFAGYPKEMSTFAIPPVVHRAGFVHHCLGHWSAQLPRYRWLVDELQRSSRR